MTAVPGASGQRVRSRFSFYDPPGDIDSISPGDVVRAEPMTARLLPGVPLRARAWRLLYRTCTATGEPAIASGVLLIPRAAYEGPGPRPLLGLAPGTQGLARSAAVSRHLRWGTEYEALVLAPALRRGWAVAVTDYCGLGTAGTHPYVVGQANGRALLDVMRAARRLPQAALNPTGPTAVYGYSEGGGSAGWAAQLQPTYAPDVPLVGVAVGSPPVDLEEVFAFHDGGLFAFLLLYAGIGFDAAYPELNLDTYLTPVGRVATAVLRRTHIVTAIAFGLTIGILRLGRSRYFCTEELPAHPKWRIRYEENNLGYIAPAAPVLVGHARGDQALPYRQAELLVARWRSLGVDVKHVPFAFCEHLIGLIRFRNAAIPFLAEHFEARAPSGSSGSGTHTGVI